MVDSAGTNPVATDVVLDDTPGKSPSAQPSLAQASEEQSKPVIEIKDKAGAVIHRVEATTLEGVFLGKAYLRGAQLQGANLRGANLRDADLREADLTGANLQGVQLSGTNFQHAILNAANLSDVESHDAPSDFTGAHLVGANLTNLTLWGANLKYAWLDQANLTNANLLDCDMQRTSLCKATLAGATLIDCRFDRNECWYTDFSQVKAVMRPKVEMSVMFDATTKWPPGSLVPFALLGGFNATLNEVIGKGWFGFIIAIPLVIWGWQQAGLDGAATGGCIGMILLLLIGLPRLISQRFHAVAPENKVAKLNSPAKADRP